MSLFAATEQPITLVTQIIGGVAVLGSIYYIVQLTARFNLDLGDRYRVEADRQRVEADQVRTEADELRVRADKVREENDILRTELATALQTMNKITKTVEAIHNDTIAVNEAVNHKDAGMPTLVQRVSDQDERGKQLALDLAAHRDWTMGALSEIATALNVKLAPQPEDIPLTEVRT